MSNNIKILYKKIYKSDQLLPTLIINTTSVIPAQLSNYPLHSGKLKNIISLFLKPNFKK